MKRKTVQGCVVSDKMDKTRVVQISRRVRHPMYGKVLTRRSRFYMHDPKNESRQGDWIKMEESRPLSRLKRWRLVQVIRKSKESAA